MPADGLGHGMLDLESRVHFEEVELAGGVIDEKLDRAGRLVPDGARDLQGGRPHGLRAARSRARGEGDSSSEFLVAPLDRAFALA